MAILISTVLSTICFLVPPSVINILEVGKQRGLPHIYRYVCMVWYGMVWYGMAWHGMAWYGMVWYRMVWYVCKHVSK